MSSYMPGLILSFKKIRKINISYPYLELVWKMHKNEYQQIYFGPMSVVEPDWYYNLWGHSSLTLYECTLSKPLYVWQCKNLIPTTSYKQWCWNKVLHLCMMLYWQVILKVLVPESLENNFLLNLQILSLFKPIHHK